MRPDIVPLARAVLAFRPCSEWVAADHLLQREPGQPGQGAGLSLSHQSPFCDVRLRLTAECVFNEISDTTGFWSIGTTRCVRRCLCRCTAECFRKINWREHYVRLKGSSWAGEMWSAPSQSVPERGNAAFLKAGRHLINLTPAVVFHVILLCSPSSLAALLSRGPPAAVPTEGNLSQGISLHTWVAGALSPLPTVLFRFITEISFSSLGRLLLLLVCSHLRVGGTREGLSFWVDVLPAAAAAVQVINSIQEK